MKEDMGFCPNCERWRDPYNIEYDVRTTDVRFKETLEYDDGVPVMKITSVAHELVPKCAFCGKELYVPLVNDMNVLLRKSYYGKNMREQKEE